MEYQGKKLRHELKYYINMREYYYLRKRLESVLNKDENCLVNDEYHVRSLYFDDLYNSALNDKESGIFRRKKFRIRTYNKNDTIIRLEKKQKYNQYISKEALKLNQQQYYQLLKGETSFLVEHHGVGREFYVDDKKNRLRPAVIVDYDREAYVLNPFNIRITFDKHLRAGINSVDIFDDHLATIQIFKDPIMILEIKYDECLPTYVKNLLQLESHQLTAASKYVMCRKAKLMVKECSYNFI